ncbi:hypothetical protein G7Y79_00014g036040 [Physcia stellaris]|nr:hypothetical protein G7Y79_00014g036040 [Physcia stellaris]
MSSFEHRAYQALNSRSIRLLHIFDISSAEATSGYNLVKVSLDETPIYTALSYTWGCPFSPQEQRSVRWPNHESCLILTNGQTLSIGQNLFSAISSLQSLRLYGYYWIDAICINQSDLQEKNTQVAMMGDIYGNAANVLIWLGDEDWNSKVAMVFIEQFNPKLRELQIREGRDRYLSYSVSDPSLWDRLGEPRIPDEMFEGLAVFLERAWFKRAWTFQEVVLAKELVIYCGERRVEYGQFMELLDFLEVSDWDMRVPQLSKSTTIAADPGRLIYLTMMHRRIIAAGGPLEPGQRELLTRVADSDEPVSLLMAFHDALLSTMRCRQATDRRDHIFAVYGIMSRISTQMGIPNPLDEPDYSKSPAEVYVETSRAIIERSRTLLLLSSIEHRPDHDDANPMKLPSWVPDFSKEWGSALPRNGSGDHYHASKGHSIRLLPSPNPRALILEGYHFDEITAVGDSDFELGRGMRPLYESAKIVLGLPLVYHTGQDRVEFLWRTLIADQAMGQCPAPASLAEAFRYHLLMQNSMAIFNAEQAGNSDGDLHLHEPLDALSKASTEATKLIPSLEETIRRKEDYTSIRDANSVAQSTNRDLSPAQQSLLQIVLADEAKALPYVRLLESNFQSRRLVTTDKGFMGIAPLTVRKGDEVFILPGGRMPMVLRCRDKEGYQLVGDAYVHGIMQGEGFRYMNGKGLERRIEIV